MQLRPLRRPPAPLAGHQLITPITQRPDDHRLDNAARRNRSGQLIQRGIVKMAPWLRRVGLNAGDGQLCQTAIHRHRRRTRDRAHRLFAAHIAQQSLKPAPKRAALWRCWLG